MDKPLIGFIGQGFIGGNMATEFEERGFETVRYSLEKYPENKERIKDCDITFIAVPTPTYPETGFDYSIVSEVLKLIGDGKIAVIKSTILPGTTLKLQLENDGKYIFHSPEFLREAHALDDCRFPHRNIVGVSIDNEEFRMKAQEVLDVLPAADFCQITTSNESELIKYLGNVFLTVKVIYANMMFDLAKKIGADWDVVKEGVGHDPRIGPSHLSIDHFGGRGAGGHCFIKDTEALIEFYADYCPEDKTGLWALESLRDRNLELLINSNKDIDLVEGVYGEKIVQSYKKNIK